jgi:acetyltransferase-like isoleucine patch superfamily enzyme
MTLIYYWSKIIKKLRGKAIKNSRIHKTSKVEAGSEIVNSIFDKHSFCGYNCEITDCDIGSFCSIANNVIIGGRMHPVDWVSTSPVFYEGKDSVRAKFSEHKRNKPLRTVIGHDVWIGNRVLIKQGIKIGTGSVIGMGSVVTKDVEPYSIVAGNPAKLIRNRFSDDIITQLLVCEWWKLKENILKELAVYINNPNEFIYNLKERS